MLRLINPPQRDNKEIKDKLSELIARERANAVAKAAEKKRLAEEPVAGNGAAQDAGDKLSKRPKRNGGKKKK